MSSVASCGVLIQNIALPSRSYTNTIRDLDLLDANLNFTIICSLFFGRLGYSGLIIILEFQLSVKYITVSSEESGQRIDNFLVKKLKGVPKSRIYKALRKGEVRANKKRIKATYKIVVADEIRVPPLNLAKQDETHVSDKLIAQILDLIIYSDDHLLVVNKPAGFAVHKGSGVKLGIIDILQAYFLPKPIYLVHRLDRETSGCLMLAKDRETLIALHAEITSHRVEKNYVALLQGNIGVLDNQLVAAPLLRLEAAKPDGEKVIVSDNGQEARSYFTTLQSNNIASLVRVKIETGRMHQIRAHAKYLGHPIAGDRRYGDAEFNQQMQHFSLCRLFLHAESLQFYLAGKKYNFAAKMSDDLSQVINKVFG
jgi:23S rRNA pseudouridine955/2504/2580 synthase